jgi:hypothetical membrane protein
MGRVTANRLRWGALAWLLTLQFFVAETVVQLRMDGYSRADDVISLLGSSLSPGAQLMNASFVLQAALILAGVLALRPVLGGRPGRVAGVCLGAAAVGVLLVGVFPLDGNVAAHRTGAVLYFVGGALGLIALAYAVRRRSEAVGTALALLGLVGAAGTIFFLTGVTSYLGEGGTERAAGYVLPLGLALAGGALWRMGADPAAAEAERARAKAEREQARAQQAERARERDAALEAAARRREERATDETDDPEDHWSTPVRRDSGG